MVPNMQATERCIRCGLNLRALNGPAICPLGRCSFIVIDTATSSGTETTNADD